MPLIKDTFIEFHCAPAGQVWEAMSQDMPEYLYEAIGSGQTIIAYVANDPYTDPNQNEVEMVSLILPKSTKSYPLTVPTAGLLDVVMVPHKVCKDNASHALAVAAPPSLPGHRVVVEGWVSETWRIEVWGPELVTDLATVLA